MIVRTIHHFEDEPELVRWIPGTLLNLYWRRNPHWIEDEGRFEERDDHLTTFQLNVNGTVWSIEYRVYTDVAAFEARFDEHAKEHDVALIDLMNAGQELPGLEVYQKAIQRLGKPAVYFLTAFPGEVKKRGLLPDEYVLPKPVDVAEVASLLMRKLGVH